MVTFSRRLQSEVLSVTKISEKSAMFYKESSILLNVAVAPGQQQRASPASCVCDSFCHHCVCVCVFSPARESSPWIKSHVMSSHAPSQTQHWEGHAHFVDGTALSILLAQTLFQACTWTPLLERGGQPCIISCLNPCHVFISDIYTLWKMLHLQFWKERTAAPADHERWDGQWPGADVGHPAGWIFTCMGRDR